MILGNRSRLPLRGTLAVLAIAVAASLAGCDTSAQSPTQEWHQPTPGASTVLNHTIRINNVFVLGAPPASHLPKGGSAGLFLALSNDGSPDKLVSITAPGSAASVQMPAGGISLGTKQTVLLTGPAPQVVLRNLSHSLDGGTAIPVVLNFQKAGSVTLQVPVMPKAQYYSTYSPAPAATNGQALPAASPSPTPVS